MKNRENPTNTKKSNTYICFFLILIFYIFIKNIDIIYSYDIISWIFIILILLETKKRLLYSILSFYFIPYLYWWIFLEM